MNLNGYSHCNEPLAGKGNRNKNWNDLDHALKELAQPARRALELIFRQFAGLPFKLEHLSKAAKGRTTPADLRAAVPELLRKQYLASVYKTWGDCLFFIPREHLRFLQQYWIRPGLAPRNGSDMRLMKEVKRGLALDLFRSLVWIARHGLPVTAKGVIHRKAVDKLSQQTALQQEDVAGLSLSYSHQDIYPDQTAIMLDMLLELKIIHQGSKAWRLNVSELSLWLKRDLTEMNEVLFQRVLSKFVPAEAELQHFVHVLSSPDWLEGEWYSYDQVIAWLQEERLLRRELPEARQSWLWSWLEAMCGFGWLELGCDHAGERAFRWINLPLGRGLSRSGSKSSYEGAVRSCFYVQPDFEIMVPPEVPFSVRWELEAFTESRVTDRLCIYRITSEAVSKGIRLGCSLADMLSCLRRYSPGIPSNVAAAMEEWGRQKEETRGEVLFPKLDNPTSATSEHGETPSEVETLWGILVYGENMAAYHPYNAIPQQDELFPGLEQIPGMWLKMKRSYHPSTTRQMVDQAIQWQTMLALQIGGEMVEFLPVRLEEGEDWRVKGKLFSSRDSNECDAVLAPKDWESVRLQLPLMDKGHE